MQAQKSILATDGHHAAGNIALDLYPFIRKYNDGRVERFLTSTFVPASEDGAGRGTRGVATRDVVIDQHNGVSARLFLPSAAAATAGRKLPIVVYIHGGSFCTESAFGRTYHRYVSSLASHAEALVVSVEYRLAPEHPIPAAYDDASAALRWVASLCDPWLAEYGDLKRTFVAGDSAGGNIAYQTVARASREGAVMDIAGLIMVHPFFWGAKRLPSETVWNGESVFPPYGVDWLWPFVTADKAGNDDHRIDPTDEELSSLSCRRVLMAVAERDTLCERGRRLAARMRGDVTLVESVGEDHGFHLYSPLRHTAKKLMESIVQFINQPSPSPPLPQQQQLRWPATILSELDEWSSLPLSSARKGKTSRGDDDDDTSAFSEILLGMPTRTYKAVFIDRLEKKGKNGPGSKTAINASLTIGRPEKTSRTIRYGLFSNWTRAYYSPHVIAAGSQSQHQFSIGTVPPC